MPYITQEQRDRIDFEIDALSKKLVRETNIGEYNYAITKLLHNYIKEVGLKYRHLNNVVGVLECAKAEFIRTVVSPYEQNKLNQNNSVSDLDR